MNMSHGFETSKFYKECMSSLALLLPRDFAVFERPFLLDYFTERTNFFNLHLMLLAL